jgi:hypothetical protein
MSLPSEASCDPGQECLAANTHGGSFLPRGEPGRGLAQYHGAHRGVRLASAQLVAPGAFVGPEPLTEQPAPRGEKTRNPTWGWAITPHGTTTAHHDDKGSPSPSLW